MQARYISGHDPYIIGRSGWKRKKDGERPEGMPTMHPLDKKVFDFEVKNSGAKSVLEFGPGTSTQMFLDMGLQVTSVEHIEKWYEVARERFKGVPNVRILKGEDEMPFIVHGMGSYEKFDLAFVDAPQGFYPKRKVHKGYEDCSRLNTCLAALERAPVVFLHDCNRPLERGTLNRLNRMGFQIEIIQVPYGMARITHGDENRSDPPRIEEPGGATAGAKPKRGRKPKPKRPDSGDAVGAGS